MSAPGQWSKETVPSTIITETWRKVSLEVEDSEPLLSRAEPALEASNESAFYRIPFLSKEVRRELACFRGKQLAVGRYTRRGSTQPTTRTKGGGVCLLRKCRASQSQPRRLLSPPSSRAGPLRWLESILTDDKGIVRCCCCAAWGCRWTNEVVQNWEQEEAKSVKCKYEGGNLFFYRYGMIPCRLCTPTRQINH